MTTTTNQTQITADPTLPTIVIVREFDAPPDRVFRAHTDPGLVVQWLGPRRFTTRLDKFEARTGGSYRYVQSDEDGEVAAFHGVFHEVRANERIVQTFTYEEYPDGVALETTVFEDLGNGRTRLTGLSLVESLEMRDSIIASGMEHGVVDGYQRLDELLASDR